MGGCVARSISGSNGGGSWKERLRRLWNPDYPRPEIQPNGSILLFQHHLVFCAEAPNPYPEWLVSSGIPPHEWTAMLWSITDHAIDSAVSLGLYSGMDEDIFKTRQSAGIAKYLASIAPQWAHRGLRIVYHEAPVTNKILHKKQILADMFNWIEFSAMSSPAPGQSLAAPAATTSQSAIHVVPASVVPAPPNNHHDTLEGQSQSQPQPQPQPDSAAASIKFCRSCGFSLVTTGQPLARFCPACGTAAQASNSV